MSTGTPGRWRGSLLAAGLAVAGAGLVGISLPHPPPSPPTTSVASSVVSSRSTVPPGHHAVAMPSAPVAPSTASRAVPTAATSAAATTGSSAAPTPAVGALQAGTVDSVPQPTARPARIVIPTIAVSAAVVDLGLNSDRTLQTPTDYATAGWFTGGPTPGAAGPAVIAGHVDSLAGPAVFYRLADLRVGDIITVELQDGTDTRFTVQDVEQYAKDDFPAGDVYRWTEEPALRLITCGGDFDDATGHYRDDIVVRATAGGSATTLPG